MALNSSHMPFTEKLVRTQEMTGTKNHDLPVHYLHQEDGSVDLDLVAKIADTLISGGYDIADYGTTYGTRYLYSSQQIVFQARGDESGKPSSLVARYSDIVEWIDMVNVHTGLRSHIQQHKLRELINVCFIAFPGNALGALERPLYNGELQCFPVPDDDSLLCYLKEKYEIKSHCVTSTNLPSEPEEFTSSGSHLYGQKIKAHRIVHHSRKKLANESNRKRVGSQPIIRLPVSGGAAEIQITRQGNTGLSTMTRLLNSLFPEFSVVYKPTKSEKHRIPYDSPSHLLQHQEIVSDLIKASFGE